MRNFAYESDSDESSTGSADTTPSRDWETPLDSFDTLVVLSNRQPYRHTRDADGSLAVDRPTGGLTAALDPVCQRAGGTWIAWGDGDGDRQVVDENDRVDVPPTDPSYTLERVWIDDDLADTYYSGYSNRLLWPICHGAVDEAKIRPGDYDGYRRVNERFAERVVPHVSGESLIWVQDYHFALVPAMIRERVPPSTTIGQFWHVPWPKPETFSRVPQARALLDGLLGADVLSFHVRRFADRFLTCVEYFLDDASVDWDASVVSYDGSDTQVVAVPLGIDADEHARRSQNLDDGVYETLSAELSIPDGTLLGLGVDRLDYAKGIEERLEAIETLFERRPRWRESVTFVQTTTPSRTDIPAYAAYGKRVRRVVDRVNERFGTDSWQPIVYTESYLTRDQLTALYRNADCLLVTSLADGMNLVSKEFVAASVDETGVLCLSDQTGAHDALGDVANTIDPTDRESVWRTIDDALRMPVREQRVRMRTLRARTAERSLSWWMSTLFETFAAATPDRSISPQGYPTDGT
ncbi:alpha,alpha-trehalose-phosphate synthase (UDP-forming) [Halovivax cerinus]|uniref:Trehalose-6-phosphate synthase n=1 Tax=Halovivax cerinus TaxID=1487865 RepID=A0ABD5NMM5_9EURY|nr:trehalose-6-phosphate synthase [Halovivax cerinus]